MTDKKTTKPEKQAEKKQPTELKDEQLDQAQGGSGVKRPGPAALTRDGKWIDIV